MAANKIILYAFKLTQLTSLEGKLKNEVIWANFKAYKRILIGSHLWIGFMTCYSFPLNVLRFLLV